MEEFDVIVIGGGTAGVAAVQSAMEAGARVALVESNRLGGHSLFKGQLPLQVMNDRLGMSNEQRMPSHPSFLTILATILIVIANIMIGVSMLPKDKRQKRYKLHRTVYLAVLVSLGTFLLVTHRMLGNALPAGWIRQEPRGLPPPMPIELLQPLRFRRLQR